MSACHDPQAHLRRASMNSYGYVGRATCPDCGQRVTIGKLGCIYWHIRKSDNLGCSGIGKRMSVEKRAYNVRSYKVWIGLSREEYDSLVFVSERTKQSLSQVAGDFVRECLKSSTINQKEI